MKPMICMKIFTNNVFGTEVLKLGSSIQNIFANSESTKSKHDHSLFFEHNSTQLIVSISISSKSSTTLQRISLISGVMINVM